MKVKYPHPDEIHMQPLRFVTGEVIQFFEHFVLVCNDKTNEIQQVRYILLEKINDSKT